MPRFTATITGSGDVEVRDTSVTPPKLILRMPASTLHRPGPGTHQISPTRTTIGFTPVICTLRSS
jgi:hypothetical protein